MRQVKFFVSIFVVAFVSCYLGGALRFVLASSDIKNTITESAEKAGSFVYDFVDKNLAFGSSEKYILTNNTADISETELAQLSFRENAEDVAIYTYRTISGWFARKETVIVKEVPVEIPTKPTVVVSTTTQPVPQVITRTVQTVVSPIREVVKETIVERLVSGVSLADLQNLENTLRSEIYRVADNATTQSNNNYQAIALTTRISLG